MRRRSRPSRPETTRGGCLSDLVRWLPQLIGVLLAIAVTTPLPAGTIRVDWSGGGDHLTIEAGIGAAAWGDTVIVSAGTYCEHDILIERDVCLVSETREPDCVTIDAEGQWRAITCDGLPPTSLIEGFTFTGGYVDDEWASGGAVDVRTCSLSIRACAFLGNYVRGDGGAVSLGNSPAVIENCSFLGNTAGLYGGAFAADGSSAAVRNCVFTDNSGTPGGAVAFNLPSSPLLDGCTFDGNSGTMGGAIYAGVSVDLSVQGCTLSGNDAADGSGIRLFTSSATVDNTIIAFGVSGAAVVCSDGGSGTLSCCNVYGNGGGDWTDCVLGQLGLRANISEDPLLCGYENPERPHTLHADSPCAPGNSPCDELIGAWGVGCAPTDVAPGTWGSVKALYR